MSVAGEPDARRPRPPAGRRRAPQLGESRSGEWDVADVDALSSRLERERHIRADPDDEFVEKLR